MGGTTSVQDAIYRYPRQLFGASTQRCETRPGAQILSSSDHDPLLDAFDTFDAIGGMAEVPHQVKDLQ